MEYTTGPSADNFMVKTQVLAFFRADELPLTLFVDQMTLVIIEAFTSEGRPVHVAELLQHLFAILAHLLAHDLPAVQVVLDEFFDPSELNVLIHELWPRKPAYVILQSGILIRCQLEVKICDRSVFLH